MYVCLGEEYFVDMVKKSQKFKTYKNGKEIVMQELGVVVVEIVLGRGNRS